MIKMLSLLILFVVSSCNMAFAQSNNDELVPWDEQISSIKQFYKYLVTENDITVKEFYKFFGHHNEAELALIEKRTDLHNSEKDRLIDNPGKYKSLAFKYIKSKKDFLLPKSQPVLCNIMVALETDGPIMMLGEISDATVFKVILFDNEQKIRVLKFHITNFKNDVEENGYIIDIILDDGKSIFHELYE